MEQLPNGYTLELADGCFPLSTDSMLLAHFVKLPRSARVLDLGSGCGTLGLLLCAKDENCTVTGLEISDIAHHAALENICRNGLTARLKSVCTDLRSISREYAGTFHCCVSFPPFFSGGPASRTTPLHGVTIAALLPIFFCPHPKHSATAVISFWFISRKSWHS